MSWVAETQWQLRDRPDPSRSAELAAALRIPAPLAELLLQRGFDSIDEAKTYLRPTLQSLSDPSTFADLPRAVALVAEAVRAGHSIVVHGDYDVDGQCATALLTRTLQIAGADVHAFVPHRVRDGYDLGPAGVQFAADVGASLIITCDCGTTAHAAVADAKARGMRVIITDHHLPDALPPADAVINPNRPDCPSTSKELCGAGVAFKLAQAIADELRLPDNLPYHLLDLVALATVADLVPLVGENRTLVRFGLKTLARSSWPGVRALVEAAGLGGKPLRSGHVGFILGPRLNAVGRIADAKDGLALLLSDDPGQARDLARALEALNARRQEMDQQILREAVDQIEDHVDLSETFGLVLADPGWHAGVIGIVASRVVERYARPTFLIAVDGDIGKGSGRSVSGFDLHAALHRCGEHLEKFGGHRMAGGLTIRADAIDAFREAFNEAARAELAPEDLVHTQRVDVTTDVRALDGQLERLLRYMEPCGLGNPAPVFAVLGARAERAREVGRNHLKFVLQDDTGRLDAIGFDFADRVGVETLGGPVDVAFRLEENVYRGEAGLQARIVALRPTG